MSDPTPLDPAVEARFRALATSVDEETWSKLISGSADMVLSRLTALGLIQEASPELLLQAREQLGRLLVDFTNVALTCVAQGEAGQLPGADA